MEGWQCYNQKDNKCRQIPYIKVTHIWGQEVKQTSYDMSSSSVFGDLLQIVRRNKMLCECVCVFVKVGSWNKAFFLSFYVFDWSALRKKEGSLKGALTWDNAIKMSSKCINSRSFGLEQKLLGITTNLIRNGWFLSLIYHFYRLRSWFRRVSFTKKKKPTWVVRKVNKPNFLNILFWFTGQNWGVRHVLAFNSNVSFRGRAPKIVKLKADNYLA